MSGIGAAHPVVGALTPFAEQLAPMFQAFHMRWDKAGAA